MRLAGVLLFNRKAPGPLAEGRTMKPFCSMPSLLTRSRRIILAPGLLLLFVASLPAQSPGPVVDWPATTRTTAVDLNDVQQSLAELIPSLLRKRGAASAQAYVFDAEGGVGISAGFRNAAGDAPVDDAVLYQTAELVRPLTALIALRATMNDLEMKDNLALDAALDAPIETQLSELPIENPFAEEGEHPTLGRLMTYSAGLPASRAGILRADESPVDAGEYLRERLKITRTPGELILNAPENYAYLGRLAEKGLGRPFGALAQAEFAALGLRACVARAECAADVVIAPPMTYEGKAFFELPDSQVIFPAADSLYTSARDYGEFLRALHQRAFVDGQLNDSLEARLFLTRVAYHEDLGGSAAAFRFFRPGPPQDPSSAENDNPANGYVYAIEGRQPGYASFAFLTPEGRGAVVLVNDDDVYIVQQIVRYIYARYGIRALEERSEPAPESLAELEGLYRPVGVLPHGQRWFNFLNEIRLQRGRDGLEFNNVFQKNTAIHLYPTGKRDLFTARGEAAMDGWRVRVLRDVEGRIIGLDSDLIRYERISPLGSAWSIIIAAGLAVVAPFLVFLYFFVIRRKIPEGGERLMVEGEKRVVIVGGGFAGIMAARGLGNKKGVRITMVDRRNHHLFQPLLYQVAMAALSPADIATPIRALLSKYQNAETLLANVTGVDFANKKLLTNWKPIDYDYLVLACGANQSYFGHDDWEESAPGLKSLEEATEIRRRILLAFEMAERETDPQIQKEFLTFVVVGGGPTGVELAGAIGEISRYTVTRDFRGIDPRRTRIILIEAGPRILPTFHPELAAAAQRSLEKLGVMVWTGSGVTDVRPDGVVVGQEFIKARTVLWAAGVAPSEINKSLGVPLDRGGRIMVETDCSIKDHPDIFVLGDQANFSQGLERPLPGLAPVAMQMGRHTAKNILRELRGEPRLPFKYVDKGAMATIGRAHAIVEVGPIKFSGFVAWLGWLFVHIFFLIGFRNRVSVFMQWAYSYLTLARGARLITSRNWKSAKRFDLAKRYTEIFEAKMRELNEGKQIGKKED